MLFNSPWFLFGFLPVAAIVYFALRRAEMGRWAMAWLVVASLAFYGWWNPVYLALIGASIGVNFVLGRQLSRGGDQGRLLAFGVIANLAVLGYFKYAGFFAATLGALAGTQWQLAPIVLPLGISFFTFTQIAYLVDAHRGRARDYDLVSYALFVTFFPHLVAGPILHHRDMMPQFLRGGGRFSHRNLVLGGTLFMMGLSKKVMFADPVGAFANQVFSHAQAGGHPSLMACWGAALAYTLQLYFDFSGYSDMALGLAKIFGIDFPINFRSPYQATSIIEFWRRWHITLSQFLRDYLYIPLGGNRHGPWRRYANLMITMLLGGLWHGAGWTFVIWGGLHGTYLLVNHAWVGWRGECAEPATWFGRVAGWGLTFFAVMVAWVFFRADSPAAAVTIFQGMAGLNQAAMAGSAWEARVAAELASAFNPALLVALLLVAVLAPNSNQILGRLEAAIADGPAATRSAHVVTGFALACGVAFFFVFKSFFSVAPTPFLYFNF